VRYEARLGPNEFYTFILAPDVDPKLTLSSQPHGDNGSPIAAKNAGHVKRSNLELQLPIGLMIPFFRQVLAYVRGAVWDQACLAG
jgi:hypothetical protein